MNSSFKQVYEDMKDKENKITHNNNNLNNQEQIYNPSIENYELVLNKLTNLNKISLNVLFLNKELTQFERKKNSIKDYQRSISNKENAKIQEFKYLFDSEEENGLFIELNRKEIIALTEKEFSELSSKIIKLKSTIDYLLGEFIRINHIDMELGTNSNSNSVNVKNSSSTETHKRNALDDGRYCEYLEFGVEFYKLISEYIKKKQEELEDMEYDE